MLIVIHQFDCYYLQYLQQKQSIQMLILLSGLGNSIIIILKLFQDFMYSRDSVAHFSGSENALITVNINITQEFRKSFPRTLIIPILGKH